MFGVVERVCSFSVGWSSLEVGTIWKVWKGEMCSTYWRKAEEAIVVPETTTVTSKAVRSAGEK